MTKTQVRCWKAVAVCSDGKEQPVWFTVPDFGDAPRLFTCANCGALLAVNPEEEFYLARDFEREKHCLRCPECGSSLSAALPYPENFYCETAGHLERFARPGRAIPPDDESLVKEFWNPLS